MSWRQKPGQDAVQEASTPIAKVAVSILLWVVLFGRKFLILEIVNFVFGDRVSLGGFFSVTLLIVALLLSRAAVAACSRAPTAHGTQSRKAGS